MTSAANNAPAKAQPGSKLAATAMTKPDNLTGCTDVHCKVPRKVSYVFDTIGSLTLPYAVAVNGTVDAAFAKKPKGVNGEGGKIELTVFAGDTVTLYLNSDARADRRAVPVYAITPNERDVVVTITEKKGKHADADTPVLQPEKTPKAGEKAAEQPKVDQYAAPLTGDIWLKISHKYTEAEAKALMPATACAEVSAAVQSLFAGISKNEITIEVPAAENRPAKKLKVKFPHQDNPANNISSFNLLSDGVPRAHPAGYAVLFQAALDNDIDAITMNSCWRPLLGSIKHRAGLGLDVGYLGNVRLNRQELLGLDVKPNDMDDDNVSTKERELFAQYTRAKEDAVEAKDAAEAAAKVLERANKVLTTAQTKLAGAKTDEQRLAAQAELDNATKRQQEAEEVRSDARKASDVANTTRDEKKNAWAAEKNAREPAKVKAYRAALLKCACIKQLFDPWYIDIDTHDKTEPLHNEQRGDSGSLERLHSHHLHISVDDPELI